MNARPKAKPQQSHSAKPGGKRHVPPFDDGVVPGGRGGPRSWPGGTVPSAPEGRFPIRERLPGPGSADQIHLDLMGGRVLLDFEQQTVAVLRQAERV